VTVQVRRIRPEEVQTAALVVLAAYEPYTLGPDDPYLDRLRDVARRDREAEVYVAVEDGRVLGCVTACPPGSPWRELADVHEGEFRMLAVHPGARGRGLGRRLVQRCEQRARDAGATAMVLSSLAEMTVAHRLYRSLGYGRRPERDWSPVADVSLIAFAKELEP